MVLIIRLERGLEFAILGEFDDGARGQVPARLCEFPGADELGRYIIFPLGEYLLGTGGGIQTHTNR
jgi:hypothetical protein